MSKLVPVFAAMWMSFSSTASIFALDPTLTENLMDSLRTTSEDYSGVTEVNSRTFTISNIEYIRKILKRSRFNDFESAQCLTETLFNHRLHNAYTATGMRIESLTVTDETEHLRFAFIYEDGSDSEGLSFTCRKAARR